MASFFNNLRFGRQATKSPQPQQPSPTTPLNNPSPTSLNAPNLPQAPLSPPASAGNPLDRTVSTDNMAPPVQTRRPPFYFREENSNLIVKGNFMTLAAKPEHVDKGEWLAHQIVEQYRLLEGMIKVIKEPDKASGQPLCNPHNCPQMTAAANTVYTWLDNNRNPIRIPASQYINLVQKWILQKIEDPNNFPVDTQFSNPSAGSTYPSRSAGTSAGGQPIAAGPTSLNQPLSRLAGQDKDWLGRSSGFPENFQNDIKSLYRQMFRVYAHMYYAHWLEPFYHLGLYKELNTCFIHFINVGRQFDLLSDKDLQPMVPLIQIWINKELLPALPGQQTEKPKQGQVIEQGQREVGTAAA